MEEAVDLASSDDDEAPAPATGRDLYILKCEQVTKSRVYPHSAKVMKRASKTQLGAAAKVPRTSDASYKDLFGEDSDEGEAPGRELKMPTAVASAAGEGASAFGVLNTLLHQHSTLQSECSSSKTKIAQQQKDIMASKKRETAANQAVEQATSEVTRLQTELANRDKTIADQQKQLKGPAPFVAPKAKGKASAAAAATAAAGLSPGKDGYMALITDATKAYTTKADALKKKNPPAPPPPAPAPAAQAPLPNRVQILQKNTNPQYGTERELCFMTGAQTQAAGLPARAGAGWFYDNSTPPTPWQPAWVATTDATLIGNLEKLGAGTTIVVNQTMMTKIAKMAEEQVKKGSFERDASEAGEAMDVYIFLTYFKIVPYTHKGQKRDKMMKARDVANKLAELSKEHFGSLVSPTGKSFYQAHWTAWYEAKKAKLGSIPIHVWNHANQPQFNVHLKETPKFERD